MDREAIRTQSVPIGGILLGRGTSRTPGARLQDAEGGTATTVSRAALDSYVVESQKGLSSAGKHLLSGRLLAIHATSTEAC